jgi:hypothetical protein
VAKLQARVGRANARKARIRPEDAIDGGGRSGGLYHPRLAVDPPHSPVAPISLAQQGNWVLVEPIKQRRIHISTILGRKTSIHSP